MKIVDLYSALNPSDLKAFDDYLRRQVAETSFIYRLHVGLMAEHPNFGGHITMTWLYLVVFEQPPEGVSLSRPEKNRIYRHVNSLRGHLDRYLIESVRGNTINDLLDLAAGYSRLRLYDFLPTVFNKIDKEFSNLESQNLEIIFQRFTYQEIRFHYHIIKNNKGVNFGFQYLLDSLNDYLLCSKLRYFCAGQNRENILNVNYNYQFRKELMEYLDRTPVADTPVFALIYRSILDLLTGDMADGKTIELMLLIESNAQEIHKTEQRQMYGFIVNYLNEQIREGKTAYRKELFEIYQSTLDKGIWSDSIYFSKHQFLLIIRNALTFGQRAWAIGFVDGYYKKLNPNDRETFFNWAQAYINFCGGDLTLADEFRAKVGNQKLGASYNLLYRVLQIRINYELLERGDGADWLRNQLFGNIEGLRLILTSSRAAKKKPLNEYTIKRFERFATIMRRLFRQFFKLKEERGITVLQNIRRAILEPDPLEERGWLLRKIENLM